MKRTFFFVTCLALTALSSLAGGVAVGNGKMVFRSPFGFSVVYEEGLTLLEPNEQSFEISNQSLVSKGEPVSHVVFTVTHGEVKTTAEVAAVAHREHPELRFENVRQPGASGLAFEKRTNGELEGVYYFLTSNLDFVRIQLVAYDAANGLSWVAPIVHTLAYDVTPPVVQELRVDSKVWAAGSKQTLHIKATDDNSGVALWGTSAVFERIENGHRASEGFFMAYANLKPEGGDSYSLEFELNKFLPPGIYVLSFGLSDQAGNGMSLSSPDRGNSFYKQDGGPEIPVVTIQVTNDGPSETTAPSLLDIRLSDGPWETGSSGELFIHPTDAVSGINMNSVGCLGLVSDFKIDNRTFYSSMCENPRDEGNGWYSASVPLGKYLPPGHYHLEGFNFANNAGIGSYFDDSVGQPHDKNHYGSSNGQNNVPILEVEVRSHARADITPPTLEEIRLDTHTWVAGQTYRIHFRAHDDLSGVAAGWPSDKSVMDGFFSPTIKREGSPTIYISRPFEAEGNGWYGVDVTVNPYVKGGEYYLERFIVDDNANNSAFYNCDKKRDGLHCTNSSGPALPPLQISIGR